MGKDATELLDAVDAPAAEEAAPVDARAARRDKLVFRSALVIAALPFVVTALVLIFTVGGDYHPAGDLAMTEMHIRDIGHHEVLIGLYSRWNWSHLGPMQFYLVAPFYWLSGDSSIGMVLGALALNLASIIGILVISRRRGGTPLVICSLLGCLLLARTMGPEVLGDSWNLTLTVFPFALLAFVTWSLWVGELWALPVGVFVTSFLVQTHIGFLALAVPLLALGIGALAFRLLRARRARPAPAGSNGNGDGEPASTDGATLPDRRGLLRAGVISAVLFGILWLPPVLDRLWYKPSNAGNAWRYFRHPREGGHTLAAGWRVAAGQFGWKPEWVTGKLPMDEYTGQSRFLFHSPKPLWLLAVVVAGVLAWRLAHEARRLYLIALFMVATVVFSVMRTAGAVQDYRLKYTWAPPMVVAVVVAWVLWLALVRHPAARRWLGAAALVVAVVVAGALTVSGAREGTPHRDDVEVVDTLTAPLLERYAGIDEPLVMDEVSNLAVPWYTRGIALQLERHGIPVEIDRNIGYMFARSQVFQGGPTTAHLLVATGEDVEPLLEQGNVHLVSRWTAVPLAEHQKLNRDLEHLKEQYDNGEVTQNEYKFFSVAIGSEMAGDRPDTTANDVAVFVVDRPGGTDDRPGTSRA
ncbi:MAG TPA: hypothetical protein VH479_14250 [Acidimicrobiales bacterium]